MKPNRRLDLEHMLSICYLLIILFQTSSSEEGVSEHSSGLVHSPTHAHNCIILDSEDYPLTITRPPTLVDDDFEDSSSSYPFHYHQYDTVRCLYCHRAGLLE